jgi:hypothetical protein
MHTVKGEAEKMDLLEFHLASNGNSFAKAHDWKPECELLAPDSA